MVDEQRRTAEPSIFAIGDVVGEPMLAHKASHEGRVAVEVIAGENVAFAPRAIPAVVFTDPELAWCGSPRMVVVVVIGGCGIEVDDDEEVDDVDEID